MITCRTFNGSTKEVDERDLVFRPSAYGFLTNKDRLLVMELSVVKRLSLPGGGVEKGELREEALKREFNEETGLDVEVGGLITSVDDFFYYDPGKEAWHGILSFYSCSVLGIQNIEVLKHTNMGEAHEEIPVWKDLKSINKDDFLPPVAVAFEQLMKRTQNQV